tara:strand:+ start:287 stop:1255 length:969 start_codon:yes stop_codon:yes gene_type:complete
MTETSTLRVNSFQRILTIIIATIAVGFFTSCNKYDFNEVKQSSSQSYLTKNVVILVIDGPRMDDTWNSVTLNTVPNQKELLKEGVFFNEFYNNGITKTLSGHAAICTGAYENLINNGLEEPTLPSIFQQFLKSTQLNPKKAPIITSKLKLATLGNCRSFQFRNSYLPEVMAADREDSVTFKFSKEFFTVNEPRLSLIHFKGPDIAGHHNDWNQYLANIKIADQYAKELWEFLQTQDFYKDQTTLFITNDHGRHSDDISNGFQNHGDKCEGCRHISLLALGPDFTPGTVINKSYEQIDLAPTIATLLNFEWYGEGTVIRQLIN